MSKQPLSSRQQAISKKQWRNLNIVFIDRSQSECRPTCDWWRRCYQFRAEQRLQCDTRRRRSDPDDSEFALDGSDGDQSSYAWYPNQGRSNGNDQTIDLWLHRKHNPHEQVADRLRPYGEENQGARACLQFGSRRELHLWQTHGQNSRRGRYKTQVRHFRLTFCFHFHTESWPYCRQCHATWVFL